MMTLMVSIMMAGFSGWKLFLRQELSHLHLYISGVPQLHHCHTHNNHPNHHHPPHHHHHLHDHYPLPHPCSHHSHHNDHHSHQSPKKAIITLTIITNKILTIICIILSVSS